MNATVPALEAGGEVAVSSSPSSASTILSPSRSFGSKTFCLVTFSTADGEAPMNATVPALEAGGEVAVAIVLAFVLSPVIVVSNAVLLACVQRSKRLRSPSNLLIRSLAVSDLGAGLLLPAGIYVYLTDAYLCLPVLCVATSLGISSVLAMAAIAIDKFTSLAQPLHYNNIMTHAWTCRLVVCCWMYSALLGLTPVFYQNSYPAAHCSFTSQVDDALQIVLLCSVYGPCCCIVVPSYWYMYVVARQHARAISTAEVSIRVPHKSCASRYAQTLAITVGCFVFLWMPFQGCMVADLVSGSGILSGWRSVYLSLPIFVSSAVNPWVYGFRNGEIRTAVRKFLGTPVVPTIQVGGTQAEAGELLSYASHTMRLIVSPAHRPHSLMLNHHQAETTSFLAVPVCYEPHSIS